MKKKVSQKSAQKLTKTVPKTIRENLIFRIELNQNSEQSDKAKAAVLALIEKNIIQFFDIFLWTYDPRKKPADRPFITWDYEEDFIRKVNQKIKDQESLLTEKTRDMGVTWMILGVFLYRWMVKSENFLAGSRKEELVDKIGDLDTLFERLRYMIRKLPKWMLGYYKVDMKNQSYMKIFKRDGASIVGESMNENFSRQGRYNAILLDEFAFVEQAENIWTACGDSAPSKFPVSTPHGNHNTFARLRKSGKIEVATLHWTMHPEKDDAWYEQQKKDRTEKDIAQELDINYSVSAGEPYYAGFNRAMHVKHLSPIMGRDLVLGWDYGWHHPCCVISQTDTRGRFLILDVILGDKELIKDFGERVKLFLNTSFTGFNFTSYGDPAGEQDSDKSLKTSAQILGEVGFNVYSRPSNTGLTNFDARKSIIEGKLKTLIDGMPALCVNDNQRTQILIEGFEGGYHYPEANRHGLVLDKPVKEGYYEHVFSSLEYIMVNLFSPLTEPEHSRTEVTARIVGPMKDVHFEVEDDDDSNYNRYKRLTQGAGV